MRVEDFNHNIEISMSRTPRGHSGTRASALNHASKAPQVMYLEHGSFVRIASTLAPVKKSVGQCTSVMCIEKPQGVHCPTLSFTGAGGAGKSNEAGNSLLEVPVEDPLRLNDQYK